jgi:hypothetical protein
MVMNRSTGVVTAVSTDNLIDKIGSVFYVTGTKDERETSQRDARWKKKATREVTLQSP